MKLELPIPANETERLEALLSYEVLDTEAEERLDNLTKLAAEICEVPICLISLIDKDRQWFKSRVGLDALETPRDVSFCQYAIMDVELFEIENAKADERFVDNPLVNDSPNIRFYAGQPLIDDNGFALGTLCVIDDKPKTLRENQKRALAILSKEIATEIQAKNSRESKKIQKQLKNQLEANFANTKAILDNSISGIWSLDLSGNLLILNKVAKREFEDPIKGYPQLGKPFFEAIPDIYKGKFEYHFNKSLNNEYSTSVINITVNERIIFLEVTSNPILTNKEVTGVIFSARNVTDRVEAEEEIKESKLIAERALKFKSQFLTNMSHEIRTPMNAMLGFTDLLHKTELDQEQNEYVDIIRNSGEDLLYIINDILDLSKIQSGNIELRNANFNLKETLNNTIRLHQFKAEDKGDQLEYKLGEDVPEWLCGDQTRLNQILNNLVSNAIKFTESGFVTVGVNVAEQNEQEVKLEFTIKDTGIGIPDDMLSTIFDDFTQVESSLQREETGTGLGLSIASNLARLMGGSLTVTSEMGVGSEFKATINFAQGVEDIREITKPEELKGFLKGVKVLICDDVDLNRLLAKKVLEPYQAEMYFAKNGQEAIELVRTNELDIIFMDIQMPIMDGYQAAKIIQSYTDTPIIAMTAHALEEERQKCNLVGMKGFVTKPFKEDELVGVLKKELNLDLEVKIKTHSDKWESLNMPMLLEIASGDDDFVSGIFKLFLEMTETKIDEFESAVAENDTKVIETIAHLLKSSLTIFNFMELHQLIEKIESAEATQEDIETVVVLLKEARLEIEEKSQLF